MIPELTLKSTFEVLLNVVQISLVLEERKLRLVKRLVFDDLLVVVLTGG